MKKVYISKNYRYPYTASSKAKLDAERIAEFNGYKNIGLKARSIHNGILGRIYTLLSNIKAFFCMPRRGIAFIQYPVNFVEYQVKLAKRRKNRVVILIHDLNVLRKLELDSVSPLKIADTLIAHTPAMKKWLVDENINKEVSILKIFDYLGNEIQKKPIEHKFNIAFAGNLGKSKFLEKLKGDCNLTFKLFGIGADNLRLNKGVDFCGCFPPNELAQNLNSHFGLVWDGDSIKECTGVNGEYLKYISPHKLSMYLSAGIPVIVWSKSAMAPFVSSNNLGLVIDSLEDLPILLGSLKQEQYDSFVRSANEVAMKLAKGEYLASILNKIS